MDSCYQVEAQALGALEEQKRLLKSGKEGWTTSHIRGYETTKYQKLCLFRFSNFFQPNQLGTFAEKLT